MMDAMTEGEPDGVGPVKDEVVRIFERAWVSIYCAEHHGHVLTFLDSAAGNGRCLQRRPGIGVAVAHQMLDYMRSDLMRIYFRDLNAFPEQRKRISDRTRESSYRVVADRIAQANPAVDAEATAAALLGSLINFRVNEVLVDDDANGVGRERFVAAWGQMYRSILDG